MKLGEIKVQALMMVFPSVTIEYDKDDLEEVVYRLKNNHSYSPYIFASVGAINRAFTIIESKLLTPCKREVFAGEKKGFYTVIDLKGIKDILSVKGVYLNGEPVGFYITSQGALKVRGHGEIEIEYYIRQEKITHLTSNNREIELGGIEEAIPYFVKADLLMGEDNEASLSAREMFYGMIKGYEGCDPTHLDVVYSLGGI